MGIGALPPYGLDGRRPSTGRRAAASAELLVAAGALVCGHPQQESVGNLGKMFRTYAAATGVPVTGVCLLHGAVFLVARHA
jgi:cytochrome bd-type quinol oxidase subunit 2